MHLSYNGKTYDFQGHAGSCRVYMKFGDDNYLLGNQTYNLLNNSSFDDPSTRPPFFHGIPAQNYSKLPFFMDWKPKISADPGIPSSSTNPKELSHLRNHLPEGVRVTWPGVLPGPFGVWRLAGGSWD